MWFQGFSIISLNFDTLRAEKLNRLDAFFLDKNDFKLKIQSGLLFLLDTV